MSVVPLMFRDWWDDFDTNIRSSRLLDQHFGSGLKRDDLMNFTNTPSILRRGYIRPWRNTTLQRQDSGSTLNVDQEKFQVSMIYFFLISFSRLINLKIMFYDSSNESQNTDWSGAKFYYYDILILVFCETGKK